MTNVVQSLSIAYQATEEQMRQARIVVCCHVDKASEALELMEMLGIQP